MFGKEVPLLVQPGVPGFDLFLPEIINSASSALIICEAKETAFKLDEQTLLIVKQGVWEGSPAFSAAWRAGI
ncbi:unnamed protein product [marine sediment metagenome]|uniref:Uncharacterized protein n=2 Tax=marine sediment metagenome TaxID=412755 RepID=X1A5N0_9ZZZZ